MDIGEMIDAARLANDLKFLNAFSDYDKIREESKYLHTLSRSNASRREAAWDLTVEAAESYCVKLDQLELPPACECKGEN
jgi:hypothetical protein